MEEASTHEAESRRHTRRMWWIMSSVIGLVLGVLVWLFLIHDDPPPADEDMLPRWTSGNSEANPLVTFHRELLSKLLDEYQYLPQEVRNAGAGTDVRIREYVAGQRATYAAFDKLMASDTRSWRWPGGAKLGDPKYSSTDFNQFGAVAQVVNLRIHALVLDGKLEEAAGLSLDLIRYGDGLLGAEGALLHVLVGSVVGRMGESALEKVVSKGVVSPALLRRSLAALDELGAPRRESIQFAYRADYCSFKNATRNLDWSSFASAAGVPGGPSLDVAALGAFYKRNRTLRKRCELEAAVVDGLDRSWAEGLSASKRSRKYAEETARQQKQLTYYFDSNCGGRSLIAMSLASSSGVLERAMIGAVLREQMKLMLAIRLFELEHGKLPQRLDELVPAYRPAPAIDIFSGAPMLWLSEKQVAYSVGVDLVDGGGVVSPEKPHKGPDVGMYYWWSKPKHE